MPAVKKTKSKGSLKKTSSRTSYTEATRTILPPAPDGPLEIVFSFDTTGSMSGCLMEVRKKVTDIITRLTADIPSLKIAVFAHGDYCDKATYVTKYIDFTNDVGKLTDFVNNVQSTGGGDWEECYELVLHQTRELLSWSPGTQRSLVMIGDAIPHGVNYRDNKKKLDWKKETKRLKDELGVKIYSVQAFENSSANFFWEGLAKMTNGKRLLLNQFDTIIDMIMAICYREHGAEFFDDFEKEVRAREQAALRAEMERMFDTLRPEDGDAGASGPSPAFPASPVSAPAPGSVTDDSEEDSSAPPTPMSKSTGSFSGDEGFESEEESEDESDGTWTSTGIKKYRKKKIAIKKTTTFKAPKKSKVAAGTVKATVGKALKVRARKSAQPKLLREMVPEAGFKLSPMSWSAWKPLAVTGGTPKKGWRFGTNGCTGLRNMSVFSQEAAAPAVYEVAVQPSYRAKRYPVYYKATNGIKRGTVHSNLLKRGNLKMQANSALQKGCKLFVRRAPITKRTKCHGQIVSSVEELKSLMAETYDYPWCKSSRNVEKAGTQISVNLHK